MNIYQDNTTNFNNNGLGFLTDIISAFVVDEINGEYSLTIEYPINGHLSEYLVEENYIKCQVADGTKQIFIIKNVEKTFDTIKVYANHIFYLLIDNFLDNVAPTNLNGETFLNWILARTNYPTQFVGYSDIGITKSARYVRKNPVEAILGEEDNSMVNLFGGEIKRDNFDIYFNTRIGADNGVKLLFGKNINEINITIDTTGVYTRIMPVGFDGLLLPELYVDSPLINNYLYPKICKYEFDDIKYDPEDEEAYHTLDEAYAALRNATNKLYADGIDKPQINIKIDWIELSKTNEYKQYQNLETVHLGDTIYASILGMELETRVIKTTYNPLTDMIESFEIGTLQPTTASYQNKLERQIEKINPTSILDQARQDATELINSGFGGNVRIYPDRILIMDTDDETTAQKVWQWNLNGLGYSSTGINGPYNLAMTSNGQIVADFITTGHLNTSVIEGYDSVVIQVADNTRAIGDRSQKTSTITQDIDRIEMEISDIADITTSSSSDTGYIADSELQNIEQSEPIEINIHPIGNNISYLYPIVESTTGITVEGSNLNINYDNTKQWRLEQIKGSTLQNGTPTPTTPVDIQCVEGIQNVNICGKNLFDGNYIAYAIGGGSGHGFFPSSSSRTAVIPCQPNTKYTITKFETSNRFNICDYPTYPTTTTEINQLAINQNVSTLTVTTNNDANYLFVYVSNNNVEPQMQIEKGETSTSYEAYTGNNYEVNLGQNLLNIPDGTYESLQDSTKKITFVNGVGTPNFTTLSSTINVNIPIPTITLEAGTYTMNDFTNQNYPYFQLKNENTNIINTAYSDNGKKTFTLLENKIINNISLYYGSTSATYGEIKPQLEIGNGSNQFYPYISPIKLYNGDYITGTPDNWSIVRNNGSVVLNGSENWTLDGNTTDYYRYKSLTNGIDDENNLCSHFKYLLNYSSNTPHFYIGSTGNLYIFSDENSVANFKTWLSNNNVEVVYKLATPTTEAITDTYLINQLNEFATSELYNGINNIEVNGNLAGSLKIYYNFSNSEPLYPSDTLYPKGRLLRFTNTSTLDTFEYELPYDLLYYDENNYDELSISYESYSTTLTKRCEYNADGTVSLLAQPQTMTTTYPSTLGLSQGNYSVELLGYNQALLFVRLMVVNAYTAQYPTRLEMNSAITQTANEINLRVSRKVDEDEVCSVISQSADAISISSNRLTIDSTNFKLSPEGNIIATSGTFGGTVNTSQNLTVGNNAYIGQNQASSALDQKFIYFSDLTYLRRIRLLDGTENLGIESQYITIKPLQTFSISINNDSLFSVFKGNDGLHISNYVDYYYIESPNIYFSSQPTIGSDKRLKNNIKNIKVDWIDKLKVKEFEYNKSPNIKQIGLIAQDYVGEDYSKYFINENDEGYYSITYGNITNALIQYCQELKINMNKQQELINNLEKRIEVLENEK